MTTADSDLQERFNKLEEYVIDRGVTREQLDIVEERLMAKIDAVDAKVDDVARDLKFAKSDVAEINELLHTLIP